MSSNGMARSYKASSCPEEVGGPVTIALLVLNGKDLGQAKLGWLSCHRRAFGDNKVLVGTEKG